MTSTFGARSLAAAALCILGALPARAQDHAHASLLLGDGRISTSPRTGYVFSCQTAFGGGRGAFRDGPWIQGSTWDPSAKAVVDGEIVWPNARINVEVRGSQRIIGANNLPSHPTGRFPIDRTDDAWQYDRNPNAIQEQDILLTLPAVPRVTTPSCVGMGMIGFALTGTAIFNALDAMGRDAPAHEIQDACNGHPERRGQYHYHDASPCMEDSAGHAGQHSALVGYALDGFGIYGLYGDGGRALTNADLDACHGHTHAIEWDGTRRELYHYHLTREYPYTIGCFMGTPVDPRRRVPVEEPAAATTANVLLIMADDFGVDASPCYAVGDAKPVMPNLSALCAQGVVFDNVWSSPECTPTRAALLSGLYSSRTGTGMVGTVLDTNVRSLADVLRAAPTPYATAVIGKWHVGGQRGDVNQPAALGFDYFFGSIGGGVPSYTGWGAVSGGRRTRTTEYATTAQTSAAISWIASQRTPWFLWLAYNAPHTPFHAPPASLLSTGALADDAASIALDPRRYYFAAAEAMDKEIGRLLASLSDSVRRNTLIVFMGDNGTPPRVMQAPFVRGRGKSTVYEGGVHVPLVVAGAGVSRRGVHEDALVSTVDVFATIVRVATGAAATATDGVSFADAFGNARFTGRSHILTEGFTTLPDANSAWAIRDARYKLIHFVSGREELYDLQADPYERRDLLAAGGDEARGIAGSLSGAAAALLSSSSSSSASVPAARAR